MTGQRKIKQDKPLVSKRKLATKTATQAQRLIDAARARLQRQTSAPESSCLAEAVLLGREVHD